MASHHTRRTQIEGLPQLIADFWASFKVGPSTLRFKYWAKDAGPIGMRLGSARCVASLPDSVWGRQSRPRGGASLSGRQLRLT